ncbi:histidine kinase [Nostoc linckia]|uniref:histidine kinase n=1 Tax=Nostoc linckia TaxID=92942 RepID=UPI00117F6AF5|nr:histidine kinase [Nostoc linckia]
MKLELGIGDWGLGRLGDKEDKADEGERLLTCPPLSPLSHAPCPMPNAPYPNA